MTADIARAGRMLTLDGVSMRFGDFYAVQDLSLSFEPGKVHAVVGQNGAGKTTFSRVVCGLYTPTSGTVKLGDHLLRSGDVASAREQGVDMVHQHFTSPPSMTIAETLEFFSTESRAVFSARAASRRWQARVDELGFTLDVRRRIRDLSVPERQSVEIVRALAGNAKVLILDEPTASMPAQAIDGLMERIRSLAASGLTVIVVLHKLAEVFAVADTVTVLNQGKVTLAKTDISELTTAVVTEKIIGEEGGSADVEIVAVGDSVQRRGRELGAPVVVAEGLSAEPSVGDAGLGGVDLTIRAGEILGIAGVEGNGQLSLVEVLAGVRPAKGALRLDGTDILSEPVVKRRRRGVRVIPFERNVEGVSSTSSLWENHGIAQTLRSTRILLSPSSLREKTRQALSGWGVSYRTVDQLAGELSGGNVQRLILSREIDDTARFVIAAQPTRGLDVGAIAFVQQSLAKVADAGGVVLLVSTDLEELTGLADRILVLRGGRAVAELPPTASVHEIGAAMLGGQND